MICLSKGDAQFPNPVKDNHVRAAGRYQTYFPRLLETGRYDGKIIGN